MKKGTNNSAVEIEKSKRRDIKKVLVVSSSVTLLKKFLGRKMKKKYTLPKKSMITKASQEAINSFIKRLNESIMSLLQSKN